MKLLSPLKEALQLKNKVVMAPMTRSRATQDHIPTAIMATYYGQRASAGLIIAEGTAPSPDGVGYARTWNLQCCPNSGLERNYGRRTCQGR